MKKLLLFKKLIIIILLAGMSMAGWAQVLLHEPFDYVTPAFIGGNGEPGATSNNWTTHNVTSGQTTTINIENGSLDYSGLASSVGNKVLLFSNRNATSRDINRAFSATTVSPLYYSALVNIIDSTQLNTFDNYFLHFGATSGGSNSTFGGRLGVKIVNSGANFRFIILNTSSPSGTTTVFTDNGADMNFGTTYLVVVKYDISVTPTSATMWINPASLGGTEPAGGISNNSGVNAFSGFASICLRNNATTPKANIDEIRVGATFADVTPLGSNVSISKKEHALRQTSIFPNPAKAFFNVKAPEGKYIVTINNSIGSIVKTTDLSSTGKIELSDLRPGVYYVTVENPKSNLKEVHKLIIK